MACAMARSNLMIVCCLFFVVGGAEYFLGTPVTRSQSPLRVTLSGIRFVEMADSFEKIFQFVIYLWERNSPQNVKNNC